MRLTLNGDRLEGEGRSDAGHFFDYQLMRKKK
jgi:hypothetical protein